MSHLKDQVYRNQSWGRLQTRTEKGIQKEKPWWDHNLPHGGNNWRGKMIRGCHIPAQ